MVSPQPLVPPDNAGWRMKMLTWDWHRLGFDGYPGWELEPTPGGIKSHAPTFVKLSHMRGKGDVESSALCTKWDDIAQVRFYQRDWTEDGIPFVREGETYWSGWWFQTIAERDRFVAWHKAQK